MVGGSGKGGKKKKKVDIRTFPLVFSTTCRSLTVVVHDVNGVLVFGEAEGAAAGEAQQRHQGTEHGEPHGWGQGSAASVPTARSYLRNTDTAVSPQRCLLPRGACLYLSTGSSWALMGNCCVTQPCSKRLRNLSMVANF